MTQHSLEDCPKRLLHDVGKDCQTPTMGHTQLDVLDTTSGSCCDKGWGVGMTNHVTLRLCV